MSRKIFLVIVLFIIIVSGGFLVWAGEASPAMPEAIPALQSTHAVQVETSPWLIFMPAGQEPSTALIIYPGGKVDPRSYAPAAKMIAEQGYLVVIVPMPLNLAVLSPGKAARVIKSYPQIQTWAIGGHSLGGAMAANYAKRHPDQIAGLVLWASYPAEGDNLSQSDLKVISIYGTQDLVADFSQIEASRLLLPSDARFVRIEGGNHAGFGWYGAQSGDGLATISREEQQRLVVRATLELLEDLSTKQSD